MKDRHQHDHGGADQNLDAHQLISELAMQSQFLVITHNKRTIEVGDRLYGVTMEQKGVSKLVGVDLT